MSAYDGLSNCMPIFFSRLVPVVSRDRRVPQLIQILLQFDAAKDIPLQRIGQNARVTRANRTIMLMQSFENIHTTRHILYTPLLHLL